MTDFDEDKGKIGQPWLYYVEIDIRVCNNIYGDGVGSDTDIGDTNFTTVEGLAFDPNGDVMYASNRDELLFLNLITGAGTLIGTGFGGGFDNILAIAYNSNADDLYGIDEVDEDLVLIDVVLGTASLIGNIGISDIVGAAYDPNNDILYVVTSGGDLYTVDVSDGTPTLIGNLGVTAISDLAYVASRDRLLAFKRDTGELYDIDLVTGVGTLHKAIQDENFSALTLNSDDGLLYAAGGTDEHLWSIPEGVCKAENGQCAYSRPTTEDPPNFVEVLRTFKFASQRAKQLFKGTEVQPSLVNTSEIATEINPNKALTINAKFSLVFNDVLNPPPFNHAKGDGKFHPLRNATFWRKFVRIYRNYKYSRVRIYEGLPSYTSLSQFSLRREMQISNIQFLQGGQVKIKTTDKGRQIKNLKIPNQISSDNVLTTLLGAGVTTIPVTDGSEFKLLSGGFPSYGKLDGSEYFKFTGISGNSLTGVTRGMFGTADVSHSSGLRVIQVAAFADDTDIGVDGDIMQNPIDIMEEIMLGHVGLAPEDVDSAAFASEKSIWYSTAKYRRIIESPTEAEKLLNQIRQFTMGNIWQEGAQHKLTFRGLHPVEPHSTSAQIILGDNVKNQNFEIDNKTETQASIFFLHFKPKDIWGTKDHTDEDDFQEHLVFADADALDPNYHGDVVEKEFFADWIQLRQDAVKFLSAYRRRYAPDAPAEIEFTITRRDGSIETGSIIDFLSDRFVNDDGTDANLNFQILSKSEARSGLITMKALETKFFLQYGFMGHGSWLEFNSGGTTPLVEGDVVTGTVSGFTATVLEVVVDSGSFAGGDAEGLFYIRKATGTFVLENIDTLSQSNIATLTNPIGQEDHDWLTADDFERGHGFMNTPATQKMSDGAPGFFMF